MLYVLGIGSNVAMVSCIITIIKDKFPHFKQWILVLSVAVVLFGIAIVYTTPVRRNLIIILTSLTI